MVVGEDELSLQMSSNDDDTFSIFEDAITGLRPRHSVEGDEGRFGSQNSPTECLDVPAYGDSLMDDEANTVELAVTLTTAWLANPNTRCAPEDVHTFLKNSHATLTSLSQTPVAEDTPETGEVEDFTPAVSVRKSLADPEYIISMIDGKPYKTLRRHLSTRGLTPEEYRSRYGLKPDYPMVAAGYAAKRSQLAKELGLGRKGSEARAANASSSASATEEPVKPRPARSRKAASPATEQA